MSVPLTLLGLLEREPSHGYDLKRDYDAYFGRDKPVPYGQVYATLSQLARDGMAIVGPPEPGEGPERKRYTITEDGATEVKHGLRPRPRPSRTCSACRRAQARRWRKELPLLAPAVSLARKWSALRPRLLKIWNCSATTDGISP
jgi:DNA-binding PadR family transcriptional regulator